MKIKLHLKIGISLLLLTSNGLSLFAQQNKENPLYNWFDNAIGKNNSIIYNGNLYKYNNASKDSIHCFYKKNEFVKGIISSENNPYSDLNIKYDIYNDFLIVKPEGKYETNLIKLNSEKIDFFTIYKKKFVNLDLVNTNKLNYVKGFYEEVYYSPNQILYIKHFKTSRQIEVNEVVKTDFTLRNEYLLFYNNTFTKINSKKEIASLFPENKKQISEFYTKNRISEKADKTEFTKSLISYINSIKTK